MRSYTNLIKVEPEKCSLVVIRAQELCESRGGRPGLPVPNKPYCLCGRKATLKNRAQELCESRGDRPGLPVPNSPYGLCGRKATLKNRAQKLCESRGGRPGLPVPNKPHGFCGRTAPQKKNLESMLLTLVSRHSALLLLQLHQGASRLKAHTTAA